MIFARLPALWALLVPVVLSACGGAAPPAEAPAPAVVARDSEAPEARGPELSATEVVQHLRGNEADLRRCFFASPSSRGVVRLVWRVDVAGKAQHVRRESSTLDNANVEACIAERLADIRFGEQAEPATARWTFVFRLVDPPAEPKHGRKHALTKKKASKPEDDERGLVIDPSSAGTLPEAAIDNVITAGYPLFARCYRDGVSRNNELGGTVRLHFVVGTAGSVSEVSDGGSDLSDRQVVDCIAESFYALRFPEPRRGSVQVLYRIGFDAG